MLILARVGGEAGSDGTVYPLETDDYCERRYYAALEYICNKCQKTFAEVLSIKERDTKQVLCPKCHSADLQKVIEPFFAKTVSKTGSI